MILITGAEGYLGSHLVSQLKRINLDIVILSYGEKAQVENNTWIGDITQQEHIEYFKKYSKRIDTVIHLAGKVDIALKANSNAYHYPIPDKEGLNSLYLNNVVGTANILDFCLDKRVKHLLFASSQTVYGFPSSLNLTEETLCNPLEHYAASKVCAEQLLKLGTHTGLNVTVLRFPGLYGESRREGMVYNFCQAALSSGRIKVTIEYPLPLDIIHVEDVVYAFEKALSYKAQGWNCLNIATGEACSVNLLADAVASLVPGCEVDYSSIPQPVITMNPSRAYELLGWRAVSRQERLGFMLDKLRKDMAKSELKG